MIYNVRETSTKPNGVLWFFESQPAELQIYNNWLSTLPVSPISVEMERLSDNVIVRNYAFASESDAIAFENFHTSNPIPLRRIEYNTNNNINIVREIL